MCSGICGIRSGYETYPTWIELPTPEGDVGINGATAPRHSSPTDEVKQSIMVNMVNELDSANSEDMK